MLDTNKVLQYSDLRDQRKSKKEERSAGNPQGLPQIQGEALTEQGVGAYRWQMDRVTFNGEMLKRPSSEAFKQRPNRLEMELLLAIPKDGVEMRLLTDPDAWGSDALAVGRNPRALKNRVASLRRRGFIEGRERISRGGGAWTHRLVLTDFGKVAVEAELEALRIYEGGDDDVAA